MTRQRNALEVAVYIGMLVTNILPAIGLAPLALSLAAAPDYLARAATIITCVGAVACLVGSSRKYGDVFVHQMGLLAVALGAGYYAVTLLVSSWPVGTIAAKTSGVIAVAAFSMLVQIRRNVSKRIEAGDS